MSENISIESKLKRLKIELEKQKQLQNILENQIEAIYQSNSWRITAPLRKIKELLIGK